MTWKLTRKNWGLDKLNMNAWSRKTTSSSRIFSWIRMVSRSTRGSTISKRKRSESWRRRSNT